MPKYDNHEINIVASNYKVFGNMPKNAEEG